MEGSETELEMVRRHVRVGERLVANQCALIARLAASSLPTEEAEILLANFQAVQRQHKEHLRRIEARQV